MTTFIPRSTIITADWLNNVDLVTSLFTVPQVLADGVTDCTDKIQEALDTRKNIYIPPGTYLLSDKLYLYDNQEIFLTPNSTLYWKNASGSASGIVIQGTTIDSTTLTTSGYKGNVDIVVANATNILAGSMLRVFSSAIFDTGRTNSRIGELVIVKSVSGTTVTLESALQDSYLVSDNAEVEIIDPIKNVKIFGGKFQGPDLSDNLAVGIYVYRARNCHIVGTHTYRFDSAHIRFRDSISCDVSYGITDTVITNTTGYGVSFMDAAQNCGASFMTSILCRHAVTTNNTTAYGGIPRNCFYQDSTVYGTAKASLGLGTGGDALDTHAAAEYIRFSRVTVYGSTLQGVNVECPSATLEHIVIIGVESNGIGIHNESTRKGNIKIHNCRVEYPGRGGINGDGIKFSSGNNASAVGYEWVSVKDSSVTGALQNALRIGTDTNRRIETGEISGNVLDSRNASSTVNQVLYTTNTNNLVIKNNLIFTGATTQSGIRGTTIYRFNMQDNIIFTYTNSTAVGIWIDGVSDGGVIGGTVIEATTPSSLDGIFLGNSVNNITILPTNNLSQCNIEINYGTLSTSTLTTSNYT